MLNLKNVGLNKILKDISIPLKLLIWLIIVVFRWW